MALITAIPKQLTRRPKFWQREEKTIKMILRDGRWQVPGIHYGFDRMGFTNFKQYQDAINREK